MRGKCPLPFSSQWYSREEVLVEGKSHPFLLKEVSFASLVFMQGEPIVESQREESGVLLWEEGHRRDGHFHNNGRSEFLFTKRNEPISC